MGKCLLLFILFPLSLLGQTFPVDAQSGKITYSEEVLVMDAPQTELFERAKAWISRPVKMENLRLEEDFANGLVTGTTFTPLVLAEGKGDESYNLWYTVIFRVEDDRYWYRLTDFRLQPVASPQPAALQAPQDRKRPLEDRVLPTKKAGTTKENQAFVAQVKDSLEALLADMKVHLLGGG
jgi:hypothetical protein